MTSRRRFSVLPFTDKVFKKLVAYMHLGRTLMLLRPSITISDYAANVQVRRQPGQRCAIVTLTGAGLQAQSAHVQGSCGFACACMCVYVCLCLCVCMWAHPQLHLAWDMQSVACPQALQDTMNEHDIFKSTDAHRPYNMLWLCRTLLVASMRASGISGLAAPALERTLEQKEVPCKHRNDLTCRRMFCGLSHVRAVHVVYALSGCVLLS